MQRPATWATRSRLPGRPRLLRHDAESAESLARRTDSQRLGPPKRSRPPRSALPLPPPPPARPGPRPAPGRRARPRRAQDGAARWQLASALRADRVHGETRGDHPRPAVNLVLYHGVLAPHARWRSHVVSYGRPAPAVNVREREASPRAAGTPDPWTWAALMRRCSLSMSSPVPAVAAACASSPLCRIPSRCRPSSLTVPAPPLPRRPTLPDARGAFSAARSRHRSRLRRPERLQ